MNCENCNKLMIDGVYKCDIGSYNIYDTNMTLLHVWESHIIPSDNEEIGTQSNVKYCLDCHILIM
jgi:hypothetical protein